jgi:hypothetical protein
MTATLAEVPPLPPAPPGDDGWGGGWEPDGYRQLGGCIHCQHAYADHYITGRPGCSLSGCRCPDYAPGAW